MSIPKSHYFEARPATASRPRTVRLRLGALELELQADRGVFASKGIDPGTMILLREAPPPPLSGDLLDLGSGYGPIARVPGVCSEQEPPLEPHGSRDQVAACHFAGQF